MGQVLKFSFSTRTHRGGKRGMEDRLRVSTVFGPSPESKLRYSYFSVFDGHGGPEAAEFAQAHLKKQIVSNPNFGADDDNLVLKAIKEGFISLHKEMRKEWRNNWPTSESGRLSTSGTTASVVILRGGKLFVGHVGDSAIVVGLEEESGSGWKGKQVTTDHKPSCRSERKRIEEDGGKVAQSWNGVSRVVWKRVREKRSQGGTKWRKYVEEAPFLNISRSLGDYWSFVEDTRKYAVSPEPDVHVLEVGSSLRCLILASDGLWNMMTAEEAVKTVFEAQKKLKTEQHKADVGVDDVDGVSLSNSKSEKELCPSTKLVENALLKWKRRRMEADNLAVVTVVFSENNSSTKSFM